MDRRSARLLIGLALSAATPSLGFLHAAAGQTTPPAQHLPRVRFIDSATGYAVHPDQLTAEPHRAGHGERFWSTDGIPRSGRFALDLEAGWHTLTVTAAGYQPMSGDLEGLAASGCDLDFYLDPIEDPEALRSETIKAFRRDGLTLIQGFVADAASRLPLRGARAVAFPSGAQTRTDAAGFFRFHVPVQTSAEAQADPARLAVSLSGYGPVEYQQLDLWSRGDWTYRIALERGGSPRIVDERMSRRRGHPPVEPTLEPPSPRSALPGGSMAFPEASAVDAPVPLAAGASSTTIRVPRNIRVQRVAAGTIDYVTMLYYLRCVLPSEWIPSWADYPGGSNCLSAGAVAVRCYAIAMVNAAGTASSYDIADTESFQVYDPTKINSLTDAAVRYTQDYVVVNGSGAVPTTEYSAENNALGLACGDGYTGPNSSGTLCIHDPVCAGEARYGHGRGMCQWGTARWATARRMAGRDASDATPTGYPRQDWRWIVAHYYPDYVLVQGAPLVVDDKVKVIGTAQTVRMCADGGIGSGVNCPAVAVKAVGATGTIIEGPVRVTADGKGFTWYKVRWSDAQVGWVPENWLERQLPLPAAPTFLAAAPVSSGQVDLSWTDNSAEEFGFRLERARAAGGPWTEIHATVANVTAHSDTDGLSAQTTYYYRVRAFNSAGNSSYAGLATARTPGPPPVLAAIGSKAVDEGALLTFTNTTEAAPGLAPADSPVLAANALTYTLDSGAPANAAVDAVTGVFTWTPTEAQGPGVYSITVRVTDSEAPPQSDTETFQTTVREVNAPPVLAAIADRTVHAGSAVLFASAATDPDLPANLLTFSLDPGAPPAAAVGAGSGLFSWSTTLADAGAVNPVTVRVTDDGVPPLDDASAFTIAVLAPPAVEAATVVDGNLVLTWSAIPGTTYRVQFKDDLGATEWTDLVPDVTAAGATASKSDPLGPSQRFYRVLVIGP